MSSYATPPRSRPRHRSNRVVAACDLCKRRKVKCDGRQPCGYCISRDLTTSCVFSEAQRRDNQRLPNPSAQSPRASPRSSQQPLPAPLQQHKDQERYSSRDVGDHGASSTSPAATRTLYSEPGDERQSAAVPLEGRLVRDALGKTIFIGDSAPLSFLQTVKQLVLSEIDPHAFDLQPMRDSVIEAAAPVPDTHEGLDSIRAIRPERVDTLVNEYLIATSGLIDLFDRRSLSDYVHSGLAANDDPVTQAVCSLVLAIGAQCSDEGSAQAWCSRARESLLSNMCSSMTVSSVQGFLLLTLYTLRASQPNAAFLLLSLASRSAYAIGLHRQEVNTSYGQVNERLRNQTWKSLRCVDMLISTMLGRPPSLSDVDCTVEYSKLESTQDGSLRILDASIQLFMILEKVVVEVYSRKRISLRIAYGISQQLKSWGSTWLQSLTSALTSSTSQQADHVGACQTLSSYFYAITLLTRPFLILNVYDCLHTGGIKQTSKETENARKREFADAALDAAVTYVEMIAAVVETGAIPTKMPLIVSWLFSTSLVLLLGMIGQGGMSLEQSCRDSIKCLEFFAQVDPHARQYSSIAQNLFAIALKHIESAEAQERDRRQQASLQLFGLVASTTRSATRSSAATPSVPSSFSTALTTASDWGMYDGDFASTWLHDIDASLQDFLQPGRPGIDGPSIAVPLFPLDDRFADFLGAEGEDEAFAVPCFSSQ